MKNPEAKRQGRAPWLLLASLLASTAVAGEGNDDAFRIGGYLRGYAGWNMDNPSQLSGDNKGRLNMLRGQAYLEAEGGRPAMQWKLAGRLEREHKTGYLRDLENLLHTRVGGGVDPSLKIMDIYNNTEFREAWVQFQPNERLNVKFGRQQVVWGETDIFQALDVIHGQNFSWSPLLEEPDEIRKPLILLNTTLSVPEANGSFQFVLRPGWDPARSLGSTWDLQGGRARPDGLAGFSSIYGAETDWDHPEGRKNKITYAMRWKGTAADLGYHASYVKAHYTRSPIVNTVLAPYVKAPVNNGGGLLNFIVPIVDVFGAGLNGYVQGIDTVLSGELVYTKGEPFNVGSVGGPVATACLGAGLLPPFLAANPEFSSLSGFCGVKRKNTVMSMVRAEKTFSTQAMGSSGPTSVALQLFNTQILNFKAADELVVVGYPDRVKENTTTGTLVVRTPWLGDKLSSTVAMGREFSNHGSFFAVALDYELGTHWRLRAELDTFRGKNSIGYGGVFTGPQLYNGGAAGLSGALDKNDRFVLRTTYQF